MFRDDCPKCMGFGAYYMTMSPHEEPIQCTCDIISDEDWAEMKKEWDKLK